MKIKHLVSFFIIMTTITTTAAVLLANARADDSAKDIFVSHAWVQAMPPSQTNTAAYMTITNNSPKQIVLVSASSDIAVNVEIHQMSQMNGMMDMAMVKNLSIPAHDKIVLSPSGFHLMLINLMKPVNKGDKVRITLHFRDGSMVVLKIPVKMQEADNASMPGMKM